MGLLQTAKKYPLTFWIANAIELFERWGWYGAFMIMALYLVAAPETGAPGLTPGQQGLIMGIGTAILYFLPVITGAVADKVGYKRVLLVAFVIYAAGFALIGQMRDFYSIFAVYLFIALGSALFKPIPAATIAKTTDESTSSIGFGLYYMMVNIGGLLGPVVATKLRPHGDGGGSWNAVFLFTAAMMVISFILVLFFYREPDRERSKDPLGKAIATIVKNTLATLADLRMVFFILIVIGFYTVYYQLFYTLPIFIDQWVDTSSLYDGLAAVGPWLASAVGTPEGTISAELMTTLPAFYIVVLQVLVSALVMRWRPINAMTTGILVNGIGLVLTYMTHNPLFVVLSLLIFALGEMASAPKIYEFMGRIAPPEKRALYMGCAFLPIAGGSFFAGMLSSLFEQMSDKLHLLRVELATINVELPAVSTDYPLATFLREAAEKLGMAQEDLTLHLWNKYHPDAFWMVVGAICAVTVVSLFIYSRVVKDR